MEPAIFGLVAAVALIATRYYYRGRIAQRDKEIHHLTLKVGGREARIEFLQTRCSTLEKENKLLLEIRTIGDNKRLQDEKSKLEAQLDASKQTIERLQAVITKADGC